MNNPEFSAEIQYRVLNAARVKRKRRAEKRLKEFLNGGWHIRILHAGK